MKKFIIFFSRISFLAILLIILAFYCANPIAQRYDNKIREYIKKNISENVDYQSIKINGFPLPSVVINGLSYKNNFAFSANIPKITLFINPLNIFWNNTELVWAIKAIEPKLDIIIENNSDFEYVKESYGYDSISFILNKEPRYSNYAIKVDPKILLLFKQNILLHNLDLFNGSISFWNSNASVKKIENLNFHSKIDVDDLIINTEKNYLYGRYFSPKGEVYNFGAKNNVKIDFSNKKNILIQLTGSSFIKSEGDDLYQIVENLSLDLLTSVEQNQIFPISANAQFTASGSVNIESASCSLSPFLVKNFPAVYLELKGHDIQLKGILELRKDYRLWNANLKNDSFIIDVDNLEFIEQNKLAFKKANISSEQNNILLSGTADLNAQRYIIHAESQNFNLKALEQLIDLPELILSGSLDLEYSNSNKYLIRSQSISFANLKEENINIKNGTLNDFYLDYENGSIINLNTKLDLENVEAIYPETDQYSSNRVKGYLNISNTDKYNFDGSLIFNNFSYSEPNVKVHNANFELRNLKGNYSKNLGFSADAKVEASNLKLSSKYLQISSLKSLSGPIEVKVNQKVKYQITSLATASNVNMNLLNKDFTASGAVSFSLDDKNKIFKSNSISGVVNTKPFKIADSHFEIVEKSYNLHKAVLQAFEGTSEVSANVSRVDQGINLDLVTNNINLQDFVYLLPEERRESFSGNLKKLKLILSGQRDNASSLNGLAEIEFEKGKLQKLELDEILGSPVQGEIKDKGTYVENLNFKAIVNNGVLKADNFALSARFYTFKGSGTYSYSDGFDVKGSAVYLEKTLSELGGPIKILRRLIGTLIKIQIPVKIKGPAEDPSVDADLSRVMSILSPGRAVQSIGEGVGDILGGIKDVVTGK